MLGRLLLSVALVCSTVAGPALVSAEDSSPVVIGYVFVRNALIEPAQIAADKLTHINYAFANLRDGQVVEGFEHDAENLKALTACDASHPHLKLLVSVGGWTWSNGFSDAALTGRVVHGSSQAPSTSSADTTSTVSTWTGNIRVILASTIHTDPRTRRNFTAVMVDLRARSTGRRVTRSTLPAHLRGGRVPDFIDQTEIAKLQAWWTS